MTGDNARMDHKLAEELIEEMAQADPAEAADLAVEAARLLGAELDGPSQESQGSEGDS